MAIERRLVRGLKKLSFAPPVAYVYNPLVYARAPHEEFLRRFACSEPEAVFLGMNPGPFGMAQTGVPFGEVQLVRDWMGIEENVSRPRKEHPKRPILGFECKRREVSGARLWGWASERFGAPERFFERFFVLNYCPLVFMEESGRNLTPDKCPKEERDALFALCDRMLRDSIEALEPTQVIGIGNFAERRANEVLEGMDVPIGKILHPSPQSPAANRGWAEAAEKDLVKCGIQVEATRRTRVKRRTPAKRPGGSAGRN